MKLASIQAAEKKLLLNTYERNPYLFVDGHGVYLRDENGEDYLDLLSGIGVSGHSCIRRDDRVDIANVLPGDKGHIPAAQRADALEEVAEIDPPGGGCARVNTGRARE